MLSCLGPLKGTCFINFTKYIYYRVILIIFIIFPVLWRSNLCVLLLIVWMVNCLVRLCSAWVNVITDAWALGGWISPVLLLMLLMKGNETRRLSWTGWSMKWTRERTVWRKWKDVHWLRRWSRKEWDIVYWSAASNQSPWVNTDLWQAPVYAHL